MMNKVVLVGELIQNTCVSQNEHSSINSFIIATTRVPRDSNREHEVHFIYCKAFGKTLNDVLDALSRGQIICISGQVATTVHTDADGTKDFRMEIWAESIKCVPEKLSSNSKVKNPSDMINQAVNLYNRYDYIGEKSVLTLMDSKVDDIPVQAEGDFRSRFTSEKDTHLDQLKEVLNENGLKNDSLKEEKTNKKSTGSKNNAEKIVV